MKALKIGLIVLGSLLALAVVAIIALQVWLRESQIKPAMERHRAEIAQHAATFLEDVRTLKQHAFFREPTTGENAGALLTEKIGWTGPDRAQDLDQQERALLVGFPDQLKDLEGARALAAKRDTGWITGLRAFGHWELDGHGPYAAGKTILPWSAELPDFNTLRNLGRLHLLRLHHQLELEEPDATIALKAGLDDVRHLGRMCLSTETLIGAMVAVAILDEVDRAAVAYFPEESLRAFSADELARLKRSFFSAPALLSPYAGEELTREFLEEAAGWPGLCSAFTEAAGIQLPMSPMLEDLFPDYRGRLEAAIRAEHPGCRLTVARRFLAQFDPADWSSEDAMALMYNTQSGGKEVGHDELPFTWRALIKVPGMATAVGGILSEIATPASFSHYASDAEEVR